MAQKQLRCKITSVSPLLMHNGQLADPSNPIARKMKAITSKRKKTEADFAELGRLEWMGGLYIKDGKPIIPGTLIEATLTNAAKKLRLGKEAQQTILCPEDSPLVYDGPMDMDALWQDENFRLVVGVKIKTSRVIRTRPRFNQWSIDTAIVFDDQQLSESQVKEICVIAGQQIGFGDWRPKFGRFDVCFGE